MRIWHIGYVNDLLRTGPVWPLECIYYALQIQRIFDGQKAHNEIVPDGVKAKIKVPVHPPTGTQQMQFFTRNSCKLMKMDANNQNWPIHIEPTHTRTVLHSVIYILQQF